MASAATLLLYALPLQMRKPSERGTQGTLTQAYVRDIRLLQNTSRYCILCRCIGTAHDCIQCRGIADLILVYKRVTTLAAHTSRVSVLLEEVFSAGLVETSGDLMLVCDNR